MKTRYEAGPTMTGRLLETPGQVERADVPASVPSLPARDRILMADPSHYEVTRPDNPHTVDEHGRLNAVDPDAARDQWGELRSVLEEHGFRVDVLAAKEGLPDLVFCCNTAWAFLDEEGTKRYVPSRMRFEGRQGEVPVIRDRLAALGYEPAPLPEGIGVFEAGGDVQWLGDRRALIGAVGPRTDRSALKALADRAKLPVVKLHLVEEEFYHLDTCLAVLSADQVAYVPAAFDRESRRMLEALDVHLIELPEQEARDTFAANLHCPDGSTVFIEEDNPSTTRILQDHGYDVVPMETSEFRKAGGSVFCMTNQVW